MIKPKSIQVFQIKIENHLLDCLVLLKHLPHPMNGKAPTNDKVNKVMFALSLITVEQSSSFFLPLLS